MNPDSRETGYSNALGANGLWSHFSWNLRRIPWSQLVEQSKPNLEPVDTWCRPNSNLHIISKVFQTIHLNIWKLVWDPRPSRFSIREGPPRHSDSPPSQLAGPDPWRGAADAFGQPHHRLEEATWVQRGEVLGRPSFQAENVLLVFWKQTVPSELSTIGAKQGVRTVPSRWST